MSDTNKPAKPKQWRFKGGVKSIHHPRMGHISLKDLENPKVIEAMQNMDKRKGTNWVKDLLEQV